MAYSDVFKAKFGAGWGGYPAGQVVPVVYDMTQTPVGGVTVGTAFEEETGCYLFTVSALPALQTGYVRVALQNGSAVEQTFLTILFGPDNTKSDDNVVTALTNQATLATNQGTMQTGITEIAGDTDTILSNQSTNAGTLATAIAAVQTTANEIAGDTDTILTNLAAVASALTTAQTSLTEIAGDTDSELVAQALAATAAALITAQTAITAIKTTTDRLNTDYTTARAGKLDNLDAAVSTRLALGAILNAPRDVTHEADNAVTVNDALWGAMGELAGLWDAPPGSTSFTKKTPGGTLLVTFTTTPNNAKPSRRA